MAASALIACVVGTRPEVIKMAPVVAALRTRSCLQCQVWNTGQHRELTEQALAAFGLKADTDLAVMSANQPLAGVAARILEGLEQLIQRGHPQALLTQGDTSSVLMTGLAGFYTGVPTGHIEAGLRTGNPAAPWPEEMHRLCMARLATWHFAPTRQAADNLLREGLTPANILVSGNTVVDAMQWMQAHIAIHPPRIPRQLQAVIHRPFALVTGHRRESFGPGLRAIGRGLLMLLERQQKLHLVIPLHPNPSAHEPMLEILGDHPRICMIPAQPYEVMLRLLECCRLVITDSGGIQEEAPSFGKRVIVTRDVTERPEGVRAGWSLMAGTDPERLANLACELLNEKQDISTRRGPNPYGDGYAAERIADFVVKKLGVQ